MAAVSVHQLASLAKDLQKWANDAELPLLLGAFVIMLGIIVSIRYFLEPPGAKPKAHASKAQKPVAAKPTTAAASPKATSTTQPSTDKEDNSEDDEPTAGLTRRNRRRA